MREIHHKILIECIILLQNPLYCYEKYKTNPLYCHKNNKQISKK